MESDQIVQVVLATGFIIGLIFAILRYFFRLYKEANDKAAELEKEYESYKERKEREEVTELKTTVESINKRVDALSKKVSIASSTVDNQSKLIDNLKQEIVVLKSQFTDFGDKLNSVWNKTEERLKKVEFDVEAGKSKLVKIGKDTYMFKKVDEK